MYVGTQFKSRSDDDYRVFAQLGVEHICGNPPGPTGDWTVAHLARYKEHVESFGLTLDMIPLPLSSSEISQAENPNIMLGKIPDQKLASLVGLRRTPDGAEVAWTIPIGGTASTNIAAVTSADGGLAVGIGQEDHVLRVWSLP